MMPRRVLHIHSDDDVLVALVDLAAGESVEFPGGQLQLMTAVPAKHKVALQDLGIDAPLASQINAFLQARSTHLVPMVLQAIGLPDLLAPPPSGLRPSA